MTLSATSPEMLDFVEAFQENRNLGWRGRGRSGSRIVAVERRKYIAIDEIHTFEGADCPGQSGVFLIDRETWEVYKIEGYGKRGRRVGSMAELAIRYREASATFTPETTAYSETRGSHVATAMNPRRPELTVIEGGAS
jgi:hypothetical protein